jgi:ketosteroid isomerase-like protein
MNSSPSISVMAGIGLFAFAIAGPSSGKLATSAEADSTAIVSVIDRYHRALSDGDTLTALSLLAPDALIVESGDVETRDDYRSHHLSADIEFAKVVPSLRGPVRVAIRGDVAWAVSTSRTHGVFRGRTIDSQGAELMVVVRDQEGWRIRAVHWSSRAIRPS